MLAPSATLSRMSTPEPVDLETLSDLRTPWCLHVAVTLRIAEHLAAGVSEIGALAAAAACDRAALHAVLGHLANKGVFDEPAPGHFALNKTSRSLLDPGARLGLDLNGIGGRMAGAWGTLLTYVQTGAPAYHEVFGRPFWEDLDAHPAIAADFDALIGPAGHGTPDPRFELSTGWDSVRSIVDVGGGTGAMLAELLRLYPNLHGTLVDLPHTVARSRKIFRAARVASRATTSGQSFFDPLPAAGDVYLVRGVLNDWPDEQAVSILRRCADAARPSGRVVIMKGLIADGARRVLEIEMVLLGGRIRTISEMRELAGDAGLDVVATGTAASGHLTMECRPR